MNHPHLADLVAKLPEVYQPVYGHPDLSVAAVRACEDRLAGISAVYDALSDHLGRALRVLDLGCAQGYFSFQLAARGARVTGVDSDRPSIDLCDALAGENPDLEVSFRLAGIDEVLGSLGPNEYDLILGLSVFHHLIHLHGLEVVRERLLQAGHCVSACLLELALDTEPLYWAQSLPTDPRALLQGFPFVHELSRHGTHLSPIPRPLVVVSQRYWVLPPAAGPIDSHQSESHAYARGHHKGSRQYYRSGGRLIKLFRYDVDPELDNAGELAREAAVLRAPPPGLHTPRLLTFAEHESAGWLIREWLPGRLLSECLNDPSPPDAGQVLLDVLEQLARLEEAGLYHNDLRVWNLLRQEDGRVLLIDYGSMVPEPQDRAWPGSPYLSVFILVHELVTGEIHHPEPLRPATISPWGLPQPYRRWAADLWQRRLGEWRFADMHASLERVLASPVHGDLTDSRMPPQRWAAEIERAISMHSQLFSYLHWQLDQHAARTSAAEFHSRQAKVLAQEADARAQEADARAQEADARAQEADARAQEADARAQAAAQAEAALRASLSWRITAPLRLVHGALVNIVPGPAVMKNTFHKLRQIPVRLRVGGRALLQGAARFALRRPRIRALSLRLLARTPSLRKRLERALLGGRVQHGAAEHPSATDRRVQPVEQARHALRRAADQSIDHEPNRP
jgi:O-antigen chain-terminating bifunctional methyltransferase/kinase